MLGEFILSYTSKLYQRILDFANERVKRDNYYVNSSKLLSDIIIGSIAEAACYMWLKSKNIPITPPDFNYHSKKTHGSDLCSPNYSGVHIKCCDNKSAYKNTWTYAKSCKYKYSGLHIFCAAERTKDGIKITIVKAILGDRLRYMYKEPMVKKYAGSKICIYLGDMEQMEDDVK